jgi:hypothetical protein
MINKKHRTVQIENPFIKKMVSIDEGIKEFIEYLWKNNIKTLYCCQDEKNDGGAFGLVMHAADFDKLLKIMRHSEDPIISTIFGNKIMRFGDDSKSYFNNVCIFGWIPKSEIATDCRVRIHLFIPIILYSRVVNALKLNHRTKLKKKKIL